MSTDATRYVVPPPPQAALAVAGSNKLFISIWVWLLLLTGFEVFLGYIQLPVIYMLVILMGASIIKAVSNDWGSSSPVKSQARY